MQSMFYTGKTETQLIFEEKLYLRAIHYSYCIENRAILVI